MELTQGWRVKQMEMQGQEDDDDGWKGEEGELRQECNFKHLIRKMGQLRKNQVICLNFN